jgi:hypothetical protein
VRSWASANGTQLSISYTLPVLPTGLPGSGTDVLSTALADGFTPNVVNIMTMDYGTPGTEMGTAANQALDATAGQLESSYGISSSAAYAMLGTTPMIGQNDSSGETFTLADAATVESYAAQQGIAMLSSWAEGPTPTPTGSCAAAWSDNATYVSGNEVSYGGDNWTASQWNYDEAPGGASGAWNNDGAC